MGQVALLYWGRQAMKRATFTLAAVILAGSGNLSGSAAGGAASFAGQEPCQRGIAAPAQHQLPGDRQREYQPAKGKMRPLDTVRLEVLTNGDKELFASPGDRKFSERHPMQLCGQRHARQRVFRAVPERHPAERQCLKRVQRGRGDRRAAPGALRLPAAADVERADDSDAGGIGHGEPPRLLLGGSADVRCGPAGTERRRYSAHTADYRIGDEHQLCANSGGRQRGGTLAGVRRGPHGKVLRRNQP